MNLEDWGAPEWAAFGAVGAVVVYIVLGGIALRQLRESQRLRNLQTGPYVLLDFYFKGMFVMLEVRNIGTTPARDIQVTFDKPLQASDDRRANFTIFDSPIPMVAPGRTIRLPLGSGPAFFKEGSKAPLSYVAQVKYTDMTGKERFEDPALLLDLEPYKHTTPPRDDAADLVQAVREIRNTIKSWTTQNSLRVRAIDQRRSDRRVTRSYRMGSMKHRFSARRIWAAARAGFTRSGHER